MSINDLLNKMAAAEDAFLQTTFMAPVLPGGRVRVRVAQLVCTLQVIGEFEPGWAILKPTSMSQAQIIDKPSLRQVRDYLHLFPTVRLILITRAGKQWVAFPAHQADARFQFSGPVRVHLVQAAQPFQRIITRFDGAHFWFQEIDRRRSPAMAAYLRQALAAETAPDALHKPTLTAEERTAYRLAYDAIQAARRDKVEVRLEDALAHAGAELVSYIERDEVYTVSFNVDGRRYHSTVQKDNLSLLIAGICLSGEDRRFDLQSLVGVIREGESRRHIVQVGNDGDLDENAYWQVHPER